VAEEKQSREGSSVVGIEDCGVVTLRNVTGIGNFSHAVRAARVDKLDADGVLLVAPEAIGAIERGDLAKLFKAMEIPDDFPFNLAKEAVARMARAGSDREKVAAVAATSPLSKLSNVATITNLFLSLSAQPWMQGVLKQWF
jgi:hypothetical protein